MPSRLRSLISRGALVVLTGLAVHACADSVDDSQLSSPPPVGVGPGKKPSGGAGNTSSPATMITSGTTKTAPTMATGMMMAAAANDADGGNPMRLDASVDDSDAGSMVAGSDAGAAGRLAAGSGGRAAAGGAGGAGGPRGQGGAGGQGGVGGSGGAAGGANPAACQAQFCFTVVDCWVLSGADCNYSDCVNFTCQ